MSAQKRMLGHVERAIALIGPYAAAPANAQEAPVPERWSLRGSDPTAHGALRRELQP
jgi:hypothetical protein